ncbi:MULTISPECIES: diguanylate cyclase domain-containing protein [unclassified Rhizobium]|uniref:diguanylate cyclase domain-containing protein n=1 Tax=Rhizobium sp. CFBP 13644 TaxID=2775307 RepID=UPI0017844FFD|nr:diguanylate cyclase [Rhizobium sp. CFBP 13644]MBD8694125.1 diguanylate cyclase [Rhizobium sp. CFBP 13717]
MSRHPHNPIADCLKQTDSSTGAIGGRYGSEDLAVVLSNCQPTLAALIAQKLKVNVQMRDLSHLARALKIKSFASGSQFQHTLAFSQVKISRLADPSLYKPKRAGRECGCRGRIRTKSKYFCLSLNVDRKPLSISPVVP